MKCGGSENTIRSSDFPVKSYVKMVLGRMRIAPKVSLPGRVVLKGEKDTLRNNTQPNQ